MKLKTPLILTALYLTGCASEPLFATSETHQMQLPKVDKASQKSAAMLYLCKQDKQVRVVQLTPKKGKKNLPRLSVTFNSITEKLTRTVSQQGNEYTNIYWRWVQREDGSTLTTSLGAILAEQCVLQKSSITE